MWRQHTRDGEGSAFKMCSFGSDAAAVVRSRGEVIPFHYTFHFIPISSPAQSRLNNSHVIGNQRPALGPRARIPNANVTFPTPFRRLTGYKQ